MKRDSVFVRCSFTWEKGFDYTKSTANLYLHLEWLKIQAIQRQQSGWLLALTINI